MNFIQIAGHLGADPEVRYTQAGKKVTSFRVATNSRKGGQDVTIWWRVTVWDEQFKNLMPHLKKGSAVIVFGDMQKPDIYTDREGKPQIGLEVTAVSIQFSPFGKPGGSENRNVAATSAPFGGHTETPSYASSPANSSAPQGAAFDDEVPF